MSRYGSEHTTQRDYGQTRTTTECAPTETPVVGGGGGEFKQELIVGILENKSQPSARPGGPAAGHRCVPYSEEELAEMSIKRLSKIYHNQQNPLPLTGRFDDADRELANQSKEYEDKLRKVVDENFDRSVPDDLDDETTAEIMKEVDPVDMASLDSLC